MMLTAVSCSDDPEEPAEPEARRAVLIYMMADNNLSSFASQNINDMIRAANDGLLGDNLLYIYHDSRDFDHPALKRVTPVGLTVEFDFPVAISSSDPGRMEEVIAKFKELAPAENYGLILWSHATGWTFSNPESTGAAPLWFGDDKGKNIDIPMLAQILEGKGFDYIYFDCCHMANVESLYELRHCADVFAGSVTELPAAGMPYYLTLPYLMDVKADLVAAAKATFDKYNAMTGEDRTCTMSVIKASALDELAAASRDCLATKPALPAGYTGQPYERPKRYNEPCYLFDFKDYMTALHNANPSDGADAAYSRLVAALDDAVLYDAATPSVFNSIDINTHCGLSSFILRSLSDADTKGYRRLAWFSDVASAQF